MSTPDKPKIEIKSPTVPMERFRKLSSKLKDLEDDAPITLELVLTALFPTVWYNIQKQMSDCYIKGYLQGKEDQLNEDKGNN